MPNRTICCCLMKRKHTDNKESDQDDQEALLGLGSISQYDEIPDAIKSTINRLLPDSHSVRIEWMCEYTNSSNAKSNGGTRKKSLPKETTILNRKEIQQGLYSEYFEQDNLDNYGIIVPISDFNCSKFTGFVTILLHEVGAKEKRSLSTLEKQITVMFKRLKTNSETRKQLSKTSSNDSNQINNEFPGAELGQKILTLCANLHDRDPGVLQVKINKFMKENIKLESAFILTVSQNTLELVCQAQDEVMFNPEKRIIITESLFEPIITTQKPTQLEEIENKDKLKDLEELCNVKLKSFLCVPILSQADTSVIALVCLINKIGNDKFSQSDISITQHVFRYTAAVLTSSVAFQMERKLKVQTETMLQVAMNIFRKLDDLTVLLKEIMTEAKKLTDAERCSVFLVDKESQELVAKVFDGLPTVSEQSQPKEIRIPQTQGVAGHVASEGQMVNITDAYSHPLFYRKVDDETGYKTRNILCFPIKDETEEVVGVAQLCNKVNGPFFTTYDEEVAMAFAVYCGISIMHCLMYKKVQDSQTRNKLANELMTYHMQVNEENVSWLSKVEIPELIQIKEDVASFDCLPREINEQDSLLTVLGMFNELGFINQWKIRRHTLARFVLMVKKGYRDPPYHNWTHAFTVAHFVYLCILNLKLEEQLYPVEILALFVASLCHDIDHRGTNNSFQVNSKSVLAALYSSEGSVLERHHFSQTLCILNSEGCNIFENVTRENYEKILDIIRDIILATDLAQHLRIIPEQCAMIEAKFDRNNHRHHVLLRDLLMTCADLSDQSKNWKNTRAVAELIYEEFFTQGDMEKSIGQKPAEQMDRERACVPSLQISFLDGIAFPCFKMFMDLYPTHGSGMVGNICKNRSIWEKLNEKIKNGEVSANIFHLFHKDISPSGSQSSL